MVDLDHKYTAYTVRPDNLKIKYDPALITAVKLFSKFLFPSHDNRPKDAMGFKIIRVKKEKSNG